MLYHIAFSLLHFKTDPKRDIKKFRLPDLSKGLTSIQIFTANAKENIIESKTYDIDNNIPGRYHI